MSKSLYAQYVEEREDKQVIESDKGFAVYKIFNNGECYLQDIYVLPEFRKSGEFVKMTDEVSSIAKENGCHTLIGSACIDDKNLNKNMIIFLKYGFEIYRTSGTMIFLKKSLGDN